MATDTKDCWRCNNLPVPDGAQRLALCPRCLKAVTKQVMTGKGNPLRPSPWHTRGPRQS